MKTYYPLAQFVYMGPYSKGVNDEFYDIDDVPPSIVKNYLSKKKGLLNPNDRQNDSPKAREMIQLANRYSGKLEGYVIPQASKRKDARISLTGFTIKAPMKELRELKKKLKPNEFGKQKDGYRFWWD